MEAERPSSPAREQRAGFPEHDGIDDPVRGHDFFYRAPETPEGMCPLRCRDCGYEFEVPEEWIENHVGEHVGCPGCALSSRLPCRDESLWPERKDGSDLMADVAMTDRGGLG